MWLLRIFQRYQGVQSGFTGLPGWARIVLLAAAIPGIVLLGLSLLAIGVSILALLVLTVPTFRVLRWISGTKEAEGTTTGDGFTFPGMPGVTIEVEPRPGEGEGQAREFAPARRRHVDVKIIEE